MPGRVVGLLAFVRFWLRPWNLGQDYSQDGGRRAGKDIQPEGFKKRGVEMRSRGLEVDVCEDGVVA